MATLYHMRIYSPHTPLDRRLLREVFELDFDHLDGKFYVYDAIRASRILDLVPSLCKHYPGKTIRVEYEPETGFEYRKKSFRDGRLIFEGDGVVYYQAIH